MEKKAFIPRITTGNENTTSGFQREVYIGGAYTNKDGKKCNLREMSYDEVLTCLEEQLILIENKLLNAENEKKFNLLSQQWNINRQKSLLVVPKNLDDNNRSQLDISQTLDDYKRSQLASLNAIFINMQMNYERLEKDDMKR